MVRSPYGHGVLNGIDTRQAAIMPGVLAIYTGSDLQAAGLGPMPVMSRCVV
jgi:carbon-monoxide dehydrogenase large subunit